MAPMRQSPFAKAVGIFVLAATAVSAWMLVPMSHLPLGSLTDSQGNRVVWGWALATLAFGMACLWVVLVVHGWIAGRHRQAGPARAAEPG